MSADFGEATELHHRRRGLKIKLPGGTEVEVRGYDIINILLVAAVAGIGTYLWVGKDEHKQIMQHQVIQEQMLAEMIYVLSLPQEQRDKLNISMPQSLREKLRRRESTNGYTHSN